MVWIYGGGFALGATSPPLYDGTKFAQKGVVLVSIAAVKPGKVQASMEFKTCSPRCAG
jgi:hypothetical protein